MGKKFDLSCVRDFQTKSRLRMNFEFKYNCSDVFVSLRMNLTLIFDGGKIVNMGLYGCIHIVISNIV